MLYTLCQWNAAYNLLLCFLGDVCLLTCGPSAASLGLYLQDRTFLCSFLFGCLMLKLSPFLYKPHPAAL